MLAGVPHLSYKPLDILIQGIQLFLHGQDDCDQFFVAELIQFFGSMFFIHPAAPLQSLLYYMHGQKANLPPCRVRHNAHGPGSIGRLCMARKYRVFKVQIFVYAIFLTASGLFERLL